eukprot:TRINITY_DN7678_c0_g1_i1.p1 TRINITY_DN7678_c0_g1~~TRINITY_DN7678_c0_g1_i1.p1  ORF type:complete len:174 (-),score=36.19 TRINITY_DN7678_c0_g1_i1:237-758(-)
MDRNMSDLGLGDNFLDTRSPLGGDDWMKSEHMTGTSIIAVTFKDGVVVGADSRTTTGAYIANRTTDKLTSVADKIYCCRSGSAADTQAIADFVRYYLSMHTVELGEEPQVKTAATLFKTFCYNNKNNLLAGIIVGGWDDHNGGTVLFHTFGWCSCKRTICHWRFWFILYIWFL